MTPGHGLRPAKRQRGIALRDGGLGAPSDPPGRRVPPLRLAALHLRIAVCNLGVCDLVPCRADDEARLMLRTAVPPLAGLPGRRWVTKASPARASL